MPRPAKTDNAAKMILFRTCYRNCRTLRDIINYVDGETTQLIWHPHMQVSKDLIAAIKLEEFLKEVVRWREVNTDPWQRLKDQGLVVTAIEDQHSRTIEQLAQACDLTHTIIQSLEHRLFKVLLNHRFAHPA